MLATMQSPSGGQGQGAHLTTAASKFGGETSAISLGGSAYQWRETHRSCLPASSSGHATAASSYSHASCPCCNLPLSLNSLSSTLPAALHLVALQRPPTCIRHVLIDQGQWTHNVDVRDPPHEPGLLPFVVHAHCQQARNKDPKAWRVVNDFISRRPTSLTRISLPSMLCVNEGTFGELMRSRLVMLQTMETRGRRIQKALPRSEQLELSHA